MIRCFDYVSDTNPILLLIGIFFIFFMSSAIHQSILKRRKTGLKRLRSRLDRPVYHQKDILGQEVAIYIDKSENYKPIRKGLGWRVGLFILIAFLAFMLVFRNSKKVEPISDVSGSGYFFYEPFEQASFQQTTKKYYEKLYLDPTFPSEYILIPYQSNKNRKYFNSYIEKPLKLEKESYHNATSRDSVK